VFSSIRPATTFVGAGAFVDPDMLVEIEATALVRG
jgi:enamine deaminase RidA (YjgF/YER057c/UK114 family)